MSASVAQWLEHSSRVREVPGSSPDQAAHFFLLLQFGTQQIKITHVMVNIESRSVRFPSGKSR